MAAHRGKGLSNAVSITYGTCGLRQITKLQTVQLNKSARHITKDKKAQMDQLAGQLCVHIFCLCV